MTHYRTALRRETKLLLQADPWFAAATNVIASARIDSNTVPAWSVSTPSEDETVQSHRLTEVMTNLVVAASDVAAPDDIEDALDVLSERIGTLVLSGLGNATGVQNVQLKRTELKTGPEDKKTVGTVMMLFEVKGYFQDT